MLQKTCTRNKQNYRAVPHNHQAAGYCLGCAADGDVALCHQLPWCTGLYWPLDVIWIKVQPRNKNTGTSI